MHSTRSKHRWNTVALTVAACVFEYSAGTAAAPPQTPPVHLAPAGETGRRITEAGLLANYFPAQRKGPAVLALAGGAGGLSPMMNDAAKALQAEGFSVLHLSYFRGPGQNPRAELIPLEYFASALAWLQRQPEVDPAQMGIIGVSKGAEAALILAGRHPELKAVIAALPTSVVWPGIVYERTTSPIGSSWSDAGKPVPHIPHVPYDASKGGTLADNYRASLKALPQHPEALIPVERIAGRVLLVCGEADGVWPSCPMARQIQERLREHRRPDAIVLAYKDAGHAAFGVPLPLNDPRLTRDGGTVEGTTAARSDSWQKGIAFLKACLGN